MPSSGRFGRKSTINTFKGGNVIPKEPRVNQRIRAPKVRVIDGTGKQLGMMSSREALEEARKAGFDLVEVAPDADPPVCKFLDYGKYKYRHKKRSHKPGAHHRMHLKEVRLTPQIDSHDLETKTKKIRELIEKGDKVTISMRFRGRQMAHREIGQELISRIIEGLGELVKVDRSMSFEGRRLTMTLAPK